MDEQKGKKWEPKNKDEPTACTHFAAHSALRHFLYNTSYFYNENILPPPPLFGDPFTSYVFFFIIFPYVTDEINTRNAQ